MNDKNSYPYTVTNGDVLEVLKTLPANSYDGGFCDPPYGLGFMGKDWDENIPGVEVWQEMLRVTPAGCAVAEVKEEPGKPGSSHSGAVHSR